MRFASSSAAESAAAFDIDAELTDEDLLGDATLAKLEAQRVEERTLFDLEMMVEMGYCHGIENYSRHMDGRRPGEKPFCFLDFFPNDFLMFIDESHRTIPQIHGMYNGDHSRKKALIYYGFRLPSAFDKKPMKNDEVKEYMRNVIFIYEITGD